MKWIQKGNRAGTIVLVGEAPGEREALLGVPFVGGSGALLHKLLGRARISDTDCFFTNLAHVRPPGNAFEWFYRKENLEHYTRGVARLRQDLLAVKPNVVVALGNHPLFALTGKQGIRKWRGSILECTLVPGLKVIPTYHPAALLRDVTFTPIVEIDLQKVKEERHFPEIILPQRTFILDPPPAEAELIVEQMLQAEWLSVDIECSREGGAQDKKLHCVGFSDRPDRALVLPWTPPNYPYIKRLCESPVPKVLQNGTFDIRILYHKGINVRNYSWETMLAHHCIYAECAGGEDEISSMKRKVRQAAFAKGLAFQASIYTRERYYKSDGKDWETTGDLNSFWTYNGKDAAVTREIRDVQEEHLREMGTYDFFCSLTPQGECFMRATMRGILIDTDARSVEKQRLDAIEVEVQTQLDTIAGRPINVKSSKDVPWLLYEKLKLPVQHNRKTKSVTTDVDALTKLATKFDNPALRAILRIREVRDLKERYINAQTSPDGRMRCLFDLTGTRSGRLSSSTDIDGTGTNLQTIPPELRRMFIATPGRVFVYRDYSQAEARVVAYLARCKGLIELFSDPSRDIHKENASRIFGKTVGDISDEERYLAKRVVHASNYGMAADRLATVINKDGRKITSNAASHLLQQYFAIYPEIVSNFWGDVRRELDYTRTLTNPFGRKRMFFNRWDDELLRDGYSWIPQSTVGDLTRYASVAVDQIEGASLLLNVHDSVLVECLPTDAERVAKAMATAMNIPITIHGQTFYIPTDCKIGENWGEYSPQNPKGLQKVKW